MVRIGFMASEDVSFQNVDDYIMTTDYNGPGHAKTCLMPYAKNKGADQPAHPRSLINNFVFAA